MASSESESIPPTSPMVVSPAGSGDSSDSTGQSAWRWVVTLTAGALAGLAAWVGGELCLDLFKPPRHAANSKGLVLNITSRREVALANARNAGLAFSLLGAALGAGLGIAGGVLRRSARGHDRRGPRPGVRNGGGSRDVARIIAAVQ